MGRRLTNVSTSPTHLRLKLFGCLRHFLKHLLTDNLKHLLIDLKTNYMAVSNKQKADLKDLNTIFDLLTEWLTDWLYNWLIDWISDWLTNWLTDWLTDGLTNCLTDWLTDWRTWLTYRMTDRLRNIILSFVPMGNDLTEGDWQIWRLTRHTCTDWRWDTCRIAWWDWGASTGWGTAWSTHWQKK